MDSVMCGGPRYGFNMAMGAAGKTLEKIRAELAWVNQPVDPNVCGCRHMLRSDW
jgi:hypothetical protein